MWQREESLASIAASHLIDLPEEQGLSVAAVEHSLEEWLHVSAPLCACACVCVCVSASVCVCV